MACSDACTELLKRAVYQVGAMLASVTCATHAGLAVGAQQACDTCISDDGTQMPCWVHGWPMLLTCTKVQAYQVADQLDLSAVHMPHPRTGKSVGSTGGSMAT